MKLDVDSVSDLAGRLRRAGCASMELQLPDGGKLVLNMYPEDPKPTLLKDPFSALGERDEPVDPDDEDF